MDFREIETENEDIVFYDLDENVFRRITKN